MKLSLCRCGGTRTLAGCDTCKKRYPKHKLTTAERGYDSKWKRLSERYRSENPLCEACQNDGKVEPATEVHHIIPAKQSEYHRLNRDNLMALCSKCHAEIERIKRAGSSW
jgi:5-methylcytosine-specific restriction protein A